MIRKLIRQMLSAQILSALTVSLCLLIDSIMISRFLGENAIAAYGLANPLLLIIGAIGTMLAAGVQVVCSRALGRGSQEEANTGYATAITLTAVISLAFTLAVLLLQSFLTRIMGAGDNGELHQLTKNYLVGFSIGAPGSMGALVLIPFLQMAGQSNLLIAAVLAMTVTDVTLDLLNVFVFHGGMFGMGLASAVSYYAAVAVGAIYLLSKKSVFRFSWKTVKIHMVAKIFGNGIPAGVTMAASVILVFFMNRMLSMLGGGAAVAAYTVIMSIGNAANCITTGTGGVSLTLCGVFYHEEDRSALRETVFRLCRSGIVLGLGMGVILLLFAPAFIALFIPQAGRTQEMAVSGLRLFGMGLIPCCINNILKYAYQASGRAGLTELISFLEGALFQVSSAFLLSRILGITGAWLGFAAGEILMLLVLGILIRVFSGEKPWENGACLLLGINFGTKPEETLEMNVSSLADVTAASEQAELFCRQHGQDARISTHISLCIEEMASNVIQYGFQDGTPHHLSILLLNKKDYWILRFRDDCRAFDPVHYIPKEDRQQMGIRLVLMLVEDAYYTYSMNLNNLTMKLKK